ncbi:MAG: TIGR01777 family oxidoreductase [bacterium]|nr:TIGR01777 family oxidoreductase [bacterium]
MKNVLITGGSGFIGRALCRKLSEAGYAVTVLSRTPDRIPGLCGQSVSGVASLDELQSDKKPHIIINLAGSPVADRRWSDARKEMLVSSRVGTTEKLISYIEKVKVKPSRLISASAVGYYGDGGDNIIDEESAVHDEFTHQLCTRWEEEAMKAKGAGVSVAILRIGLVIGRGGGFLSKMLLPFKLGLGGRIGSGAQWMPWIHIDDIVGLIMFLIEREELEGPFNAVSPEPVTNSDFTKTLADTLKRPAIFPVPSFVLKLALGEISRLILTGQRAVPKRAIKEGYSFAFTKLADALREVV